MTHWMYAHAYQHVDSEGTCLNRSARRVMTMMAALIQPKDEATSGRQKQFCESQRENNTSPILHRPMMTAGLMEPIPGLMLSCKMIQSWLSACRCFSFETDGLSCSLARCLHLTQDSGGATVASKVFNVLIGSSVRDMHHHMSPLSEYGIYDPRALTQGLQGRLIMDHGRHVSNSSTQRPTTNTQRAVTYLQQLPPSPA